MVNKQKILSVEGLPKHVAFIVDGNGRWATLRGLPRNVGHKFGMEKVKEIIDSACEFKIPFLTFFLFSTENWKRDKAEVDYIFNLLRKYLDENLKKCLEKGYRIITSGDISKLPEDIYEKLKNVIEKTKDGKNITVNFAINYGGRDEILRAVNLIIKDGVKEVDAETFKKYLYTAEIPDPDLIVRTGGEVRISNFLLYQLSYAEFYFTKVKWPDFGEKSFITALWNYMKRDRRFGDAKA